MKITRITSTYYAWQRPVAITNGLHTYGGVRLCVVKVETDEGVTGIGIGGAKAGERQFRAAFAAKLIGADPMLTEAIWAKFWMPAAAGSRRGRCPRSTSHSGT
jgi:L-alanine-DL-glutamate epimerase-like enolase superfamily enzyme